MLQLAACLEKVSHQDHAETQKDSLTSSHHSSTQTSDDEMCQEMNQEARCILTTMPLVKLLVEYDCGYMVSKEQV